VGTRRFENGRNKPAPGIDSSGRVPRRQLGHVQIGAVTYPLIDVGGWVDPASGGTNASVVYHPGNVVSVADVAYVCVADTTTSPPGAAWSIWDDANYFLNANRVWVKVPAGLFGGPGLADTIVALGFDAVWPLDEGSGVIGHDVSGNGLDLSVPGGFGAPTWGQPAGPPGTQTAKFAFATPAQLSRASYPALVGDFTAVIFVNRPVWGGGGVTPGIDIFGQGAFGGQGGGSHPGWSLTREASNQGSGDRYILFIGGSGGGHLIVGDNAIADGAFYCLGITRASGVWRMYVDGLLESTIYTEGTYLSASGIWVGAGVNPAVNDMLASYAMIHSTRALSGAEMLEIPTIATTGGFPPVGTFWMPDGTGGGSYGYPTWTVYQDGV
jgi:hypothetical protein